MVLTIVYLVFAAALANTAFLALQGRSAASQSLATSGQSIEAFAELKKQIAGLRQELAEAQQALAASSKQTSSQVQLQLDALDVNALRARPRPARTLAFDPQPYTKVSDLLAAFNEWQAQWLHQLGRVDDEATNARHSSRAVDHRDEPACAHQAGNAHIPCVVLVHFHNVGWGNRLPSLVTGALLAATSGRLLMVKLDASFKQHLDLLTGADWARYSHAYGSAATCEVELTQLASEDLDWCKQTHQRTPVMTYASASYDTPLLQVNPALQGRLEALFPDGAVFRALSRHLFKPSALVLEAMAPYADLAADCAVGVHVRTIRAPPPFTQADFQRIAGLVRMLVPGRAGSVMLAADKDVFSDIKQQLPERRVWWTNITHDALSRNAAIGGNPGIDVAAVADLYLLSRCRHIVASAGSTFSYMAAAIGNVKPAVYQPGPRESPAHQPWVWLAAVSEMCMWKAGKNEMAKWPEALADLFRERHPLFLWHNQCHP